MPTFPSKLSGIKGNQKPNPVKIPPEPNPGSVNSDIVIPSYFSVIGGLNFFNEIANTVLASQVIKAYESKAELYKRSNIDEATSNEVSRITKTKIYEPDAIPDGNGGYSESSCGFWTKRLSAITGMPVMTAITFVGTTYTSLSGQQITIPTITFEMVLIKMKKGRDIEKTNITGRDTGSVKEYIGAKDWEIEIEAIIMASQNVSDNMAIYYQNGKYPEENMEKIDLLLAAPIAIQIICPYINKRGISYLVIDDGVQINQIEGEYEVQRLTIPCVSDSPILLQIAT